MYISFWVYIAKLFISNLHQYLSMIFSAVNLRFSRAYRIPLFYDLHNLSRFLFLGAIHLNSLWENFCCSILIRWSNHFNPLISILFSIVCCTLVLSLSSFLIPSHLDIPCYNCHRLSIFKTLSFLFISAFIVYTCIYICI